MAHPITTSRPRRTERSTTHRPDHRQAALVLATVLVAVVVGLAMGPIGAVGAAIVPIGTRSINV